MQASRGQNVQILFCDLLDQLLLGLVQDICLNKSGSNHVRVCKVLVKQTSLNIQLAVGHLV